MFVSSGSVLRAILFGAILISPVAVGSFNLTPYAPFGLVSLLFAAYAFKGASGRRSKQVCVALLSACFAVTLFDLAARPLLLYLYGVRPAERYIRPWPALPRLQRYEPNVNFEGTTYGDLAAVSGRADWRESRLIRFVTDGYGFRNEPPDPRRGARAVDLIVLGDSFGVAAGTSQEEILSSLLARDFGLSVYNLSMSRENPRQEYANLLLEGERLNTREGACVLWLIFTGNDLDEPYYTELDHPRPVRPGPLTLLVNSLGVFRSRSPVRGLLSRGGSGVVIERSFVDGRRMLFNETYARRRGRTADDVMRHPNFANLSATIAAMRELAGERRLNVAVALVPSKEEVYSWVLDGAPPWSTAGAPSGFSDALRGLCERHGLRFLDLKPALVEASKLHYERSGALLWWSDDTHWNGDGQRVAAAAVYANLLRVATTR